MKTQLEFKIVFLLLIGLCNVLSINAQQRRSTLKDLNWLLGTWERTNIKPGRRGIESWKALSAKEFNGKGLTLAGRDTLFSEQLKFVERQDGLFYVADVAVNKAPTYFKITSLGPKGFICENPQHDFPKKIEYKLLGDKLTAVVSGGGKRIVFEFRKINPLRAE
ncbi:MAG: DUF6265 family protein [Bacteroidota bacterium]